uniref:D-2-hydroxyglutarate dehydrogenase, mitochondrial n=1 Tax=Parastrongyloides trichosuri TaxID=131310 RepID=A0A0N4ZEA8_PARTI
MFKQLIKASIFNKVSYSSLIRRPFKRLTNNDINNFKSILGSDYVKEKELDNYNQDWMKWYKGKSECVLLPNTTEEISEIIKYCYQENIAIVPQSGNTGLVGGSIPIFDEVILSLKRLRNNFYFDAASGIIECDAGYILEEINQKLEEYNYMMPIDLGAKGSCFIGGNVATCAGGIRLIRYGNIHANILGLDAVIADKNGSILKMGSKLRKDNTDLHLAHLFVGSEGQLGIITNVKMLAVPIPKNISTSFLSVKTFNDCKEILRLAKMHLNENLSSFEFLDHDTLECVNEFSKISIVFNETPNFALLIEVAGSDGDYISNRMESFLSQCYDKNLIVDGVVTNGINEAKNIWSIREGAPLSVPKEGYVYKYDISLPIQYFYELNNMLKKRLEKDKEKLGILRICSYGHLGDGNVHLNIICKQSTNDIYERVHPHIYDWIAAHNGSISAEHGIGQLKKSYMPIGKNLTQVLTSKALKNFFDPKGILNPYKFSVIMIRVLRYFPKKKVISFLLYGLVFFTIFCIMYTLRKSSYIQTNWVSRNEEILMAKFVRDEALAGRSIGENPFEEYKSLPKKDWHDYKGMEEDSKRVGNGEQGKPFAVPNDTPDIEKKRDKLYRVNGYDAYVSDLIPLNRSIKDIRHPECKNVKYVSKLPTVSVIFPFHNEHKSTILRSVYSILNRSPKGVVTQIVLVNDASTKPELNEPLNEELKERGLSNVVQMIINKKREGLIRARQIGAFDAIGEILVFLDAHSEANYNWLPPLIEPIIMDYKTIVCPFVDVIDCNTYEYRAQDEGARGSFDWNFNYKRLPLTKKDKQNPTKPFPSPVMAGGYFAISAKWFWELGGYDEGLDIWGGEQYELSFKTWQCHGSMVDAPCSRIGHIYRCKYVPFPNPGIGDFVSRNYKRVAVVWMDEYAKYLYKRKPVIEKTDPGNISKQLAVRERLNCKSFDWFMKNVAFDQDKYYPAIEPDDSANGTIVNLDSGLCIDATNLKKNDQLRVQKCGGGRQIFALYYRNDIRIKRTQDCLDSSSSNDGNPVVLFPCHGMGGNQRFTYDVESKQIIHKISGNCLEANSDGTGSGNVFTSECDYSKKSQKWKFSYYNKKLIEERRKFPDRDFDE